MEKLLVIRFSSIGDIILTTPVIERLKTRTPDLEIHYLTLDRFSGILEGNPHVSRIIRLDSRADAARLRRLCRRLMEYGYTAYVDCHNSLRTRIMRGYLKRERWFVYRKPRLNRFLLFNLHINRFSPDYDIPSEYLKLFNGEAGEAPPPRPKVYVSSAEKKRCRRYLDQQGVSGEFVALIPGASWQTKVWLPSGYIDVANALATDEGLGVVILGGSGDAICDQIAQVVPQALNLKGKTGLRESLAILACATAAVGGDTGLTHGAEAVGTPVVMLLGPTSYQTGARVRHPRSVVIATQPWCQPCSKNGGRPCYREERVCLSDIYPHKVLSSIERIMARA